MEDVAELDIRDDFGLDLVVGDEFVHDNDVFEFGLGIRGCTLQMGQELFLLMTRIL